ARYAKFRMPSVSSPLNLLTIVNYSPLVMELTRRYQLHFDIATIRIATVAEPAVPPIEEGIQNLQIQQGEAGQRKVDELTRSVDALKVDNVNLRNENGELTRRLDEIEKKNDERMEKMEQKYRQMLMMV
ncbi:hypothetical protein PFISCL1PPCAC_9164, partial [Pristionchus fissidentatus]